MMEVVSHKVVVCSKVVVNVRRDSRVEASVPLVRKGSPRKEGSRCKGKILRSGRA